MQKKRSKSSKPNTKKKVKPKCKMCKENVIVYINLREALYRKYSSSQNHHYLKLLNQTLVSQKTNIQSSFSIKQQFLEKYYKNFNRKHLFPKIKQIYKLHKQIPRIFHPIIKNILDKCYHRKRLLEYFKMAKILGLKVQSVKFSTFLLSITQKQNDSCLSYDKIINQISGYQFSEEIEKQLLQTMEGRKQNLNPEYYQQK